MGVWGLSRGQAGMTTLTELLFIFDDIWVDPNWLYAIVQLGVLGVFLVAAYRAWRHSSGRLLELLSAVIFGLILEEMDIIIFQTYRYDPHWFAIDLVPPAIALCWAIIIASAMNISDSLGIDERLAPFADATWAIILDLSLDAVAIRLGLWQWNIPQNADWFGVPYGNFFAWLWVATAFSFFTRLVRRRTAKRGDASKYWQLLVPVPAYLGLLAGVSPYAFLQAVYFHEVGSDWILITIAFLVFGLITFHGVVTRNKPREAPDPYHASMRYMMHGYYLMAIVATGMFFQSPGLLAISLTMLALETVVTFIVFRDYVAERNLFALADLILNRRSRE